MRPAVATGTTRRGEHPDRRTVSTGTPLRAVPGESPARGEVLAQLQARLASDFAGFSARVQAAAHERRRVSPAVRAALRHTAWALARIEAGHYGTCTVCGAAIDIDRLRACPTVGTCRACDPSAASSLPVSGSAGGAQQPQRVRGEGEHLQRVVGRG